MRKIIEHNLKFAIVLEDRFSKNSDGTPNIEYAKANVNYLEEHYFHLPNYVRSKAEKPLLLVFGPITFQSEAEWTDILQETDVALLPLWYEFTDAGRHSAGEYSWVWSRFRKRNKIMWKIY